MDKMEGERRIEARRQRKAGQPATHLITPQILTESAETLSLESPASSFFIPLPGLLDEAGIALAYWPLEIEELIFRVKFEGLRGELEHFVTLTQKQTVHRLEERIDRPCKVSFRLDEVRYHEEMRDGRKRLFIPTCFSLVFRPDQSTCSKVRS